jgi:phage baseplate assembly protein W
VPDVPHLSLPLRVDSATGHLAEVEQDSVDDVAACAEAVLRTRPGERDEHPHFGSPELVFAQMPVSTEGLVAAVETWEPRARVLVEENPDLADELLTRLRVRVGTEG